MTEVWGTSDHPSAPLCVPEVTTKRQRLGVDLPVVDPPEVDLALDPKRFLFCEFFAGVGALTSAVSAAGVPVRPPEDLAVAASTFPTSLPSTRYATSSDSSPLAA